jgi:hypothetical protein
MKKFIIIGFCLSLLVISTLLVWHYIKHPSDATIRRELPGTWVARGGGSTCTINSDGYFVTQITGKHIGRFEGTWQVEHGYMIYTITKSSFTGHWPAMLSVRILSMDGHKLAVQQDGANRVEVSQKVEP